MDSSNCSCCCGCQYSTPPWWVTMGFAPPYNNQQSQGQPVPPVPGSGQGNLIPPNLPGLTGLAGPSNPGTQSSGGGLGGIIGGILNPLGSLLGGL